MLIQNQIPHAYESKNFLNQQKSNNFLRSGKVSNCAGEVVLAAVQLWFWYGSRFSGTAPARTVVALTQVEGNFFFGKLVTLIWNIINVELCE